MGSTFHRGKWVERYGLTCGFWTNRASKLDQHVLAHVAAKKGDVFDMFASQYGGEKLHQCRDGVQ